jgi:hypothetical protein
MSNINYKISFFNSATAYDSYGTPTTDYTVGDTLTVKLFGVETAYKSAFQGITFLASDGTTELAYTPTSEGWNSEDNTEYDMTFTVPDTFSGMVYINTKFDTTNMYDIDYNIAFAEGLVSASIKSIDKNQISKALPGTTVKLKINVTLIDGSTELALNNWSNLSGISASDFGAWTITRHMGTNFQMACTFTMPSNNVAMTANFRDASTPATTHLVTFRADYQVISSFSVNDGEIIPTSSIPEVPSSMIPEGKAFDYWAENGTEFDFDTQITNDTVLVAIFKDVTVTHTVTFKNGLITVDTVEVEEGTSIPSADIPTVVPPTGMEFDYWVDEYNNQFNFSTLITEDITLYAKFKVITYTVTFKEGDTTIKTVKVAYNHTVSYIDPQHMTDASGKEFMYWVNSNSQKFDFSTPITEDTTLTAYYAQAGSSKWIMSLPNCFVGLKSDIDYLPIARVDDGTKALALSETAGEETAYIFHKASLTWIELQHYTVNI